MPAPRTARENLIVILSRPRWHSSDVRRAAASRWQWRMERGGFGLSVLGVLNGTLRGSGVTLIVDQGRTIRCVRSWN